MRSPRSSSKSSGDPFDRLDSPDAGPCHRTLTDDGPIGEMGGREGEESDHARGHSGDPSPDGDGRNEASNGQPATEESADHGDTIPSLHLSVP